MKAGKAWKFGNDVDTDAIIPGRYLDNYSPEFLASHVMEGVDGSFAKKVSRGDIIVSGEHFGIGSSREQAAIAIMAAGVEIILAESFARIFYRNAVNRGMLPLICPGCSKEFEEGETICVDVENRKAYSERDPARSLELQGLSPLISKIHSSGGLVNLLREELRIAEGDGKNK